MGFMDIFNLIAGLSSILGLCVSLFIASKVIKIDNNIHIKGDNNKIVSQNNEQGDNNVSL